jgi:FixJ family two-component response regulator
MTVIAHPSMISDLDSAFFAIGHHRENDAIILWGMVTLPATPMISIIDDDDSVRIATKNLVRSLGYEVSMFASAEAFLQSPTLTQCACVIADVQMPTMSGVELQYHLRELGHRVPFIFITAFPEAGIRARALEDGAVAFLAKPFDGGILIECIDAALKRGCGGQGQ